MIRVRLCESKNFRYNYEVVAEKKINFLNELFSFANIGKRDCSKTYFLQFLVVQSWKIKDKRCKEGFREEKQLKWVDVEL